MDLEKFQKAQKLNRKIKELDKMLVDLELSTGIYFGADGEVSRTTYPALYTQMVSMITEHLKESRREIREEFNDL